MTCLGIAFGQDLPRIDGGNSTDCEGALVLIRDYKKELLFAWLQMHRLALKLIS